MLLSRKQSAVRERLYAEGKNDREIARAQSVTPASIRNWRAFRNLPPNFAPASGDFRRLTAEQEAERQALYHQGMGDVEVAKLVGCCQQTIHKWRKLRGLPAHGGISAADKRRRRRLIEEGASNRMIAEITGRSAKSVWSWRERNGLTQGVRGDNKLDGHKAKHRDGMMRQIYAAIPNWLAPDLADETAGEVCLAVISKSIRHRDIRAKTAAIANRVVNSYASKFGARSLDEILPGTEDFRLIDTLRDQSSSAWLEEMGATVW